MAELSFPGGDIVDSGPERWEQVLGSLVRTFVDPRTGVIRRLVDDRGSAPGEPEIAMVAAELAPTGSWSRDGTVAPAMLGGRSTETAAALRGAIFEALERYCLAVQPRSPAAIASTRELAGVAVLAPSEFGVDPDTDVPFSWTGAREWASDRSVLVPSQVVYTPYVYRGEPLIRDCVSTGAAAGLSYEGARLRGLLEVVERDAVMLAHYAKTPLRALDPEGLAEPGLRAAVRSLTARGVEVTLREVSDACAPTVIALLAEPGGTPEVSVGTASDLSLVDAAEAALLEAVAHRRAVVSSAEAFHREGKNLGADWAESVAQRLIRVSLPGQLERVGHLRAPASEWSDIRRRIDLDDLVRAVGAVGPVVWVDVTTPDVRRRGVVVVKVIAPGLQPMHLTESAAVFTPRLRTFCAAGAPPEDRPTHPYL